jgi:hypothetical protein
MRNLQIMGMGILGLIAAFWLAVYPVEGLTMVALVPFALIAAGQLYLPRSKRAIQVWFDPKILIELAEGETIELPLEQHMRLSGIDVQPSHFKQWHEFEVVTYRYWLLLALGLASLAGVVAIHRLGTRDFGFNGIGPLYWGALFWVACVSTAWRWLRERRTLRMSGLALGSFSVSRGHHPAMRHIRYHFIDHEGEYRGGSFDSMFCDQSDDFTLIFYDEDDPDVSVPASAMVFHRINWKNTRSRSISDAGSTSAAL